MLVGLALTVAPVELPNPVDGDQLNELASDELAVKFTEVPEQIVGAAGTKFTVGLGFTVITTWSFCDGHAPAGNV